MLQILDHEGNVLRPELLPKWSDEKFLEIYRLFVFLRMADQKLVNLQRQGRSGTYAPIEGQEACQIGSGLALDKKTDWIFPSFRELGICFLHGAPLEKIYLYWMGNEWGSHVDANVAPVSIPVGSHPAHAVGFAWGLKMQKKPGITVSCFGDGATSTGDFYEAMNFAGVFKIPTIFFCQNNQWAISVPRSRQTATKTLSQKAVAAEISGIQVDGNDIFACFSAMSEAVLRARKGEGATLIEAVTYRATHHTTSDDEMRYRPREEVKYWKARDPISRYKLFLQKKKLWKDDLEKAAIKEADAKITRAVEIAEKTPPPAPEEMFDYLYAEPTPTLKEQKNILLKFLI
ncbi:pyruvate dehydrogenase (acetyl-transferring) E1 component subunit alpha [Candidatus Peregrinibacteria bacterium]|nr:pyruvate dehydrogenase (acetyl-transferring) E1 component subunit alpha [Candidatus Peregrinibacteria bacterium]